MVTKPIKRIHTESDSDTENRENFLGFIIQKAEDKTPLTKQSLFLYKG